MATVSFTRRMADERRAAIERLHAARRTSGDDARRAIDAVLDAVDRAEKNRAGEGPGPGEYRLEVTGAGRIHVKRLRPDG